MAKFQGVVLNTTPAKVKFWT